MSRMKRLVAAVDGWWFGPVDARAVGLMRLLLGLLLVWSHLALYPELEHILGPDAYVSVEALTRGYTATRWSFYDAPALPLPVLHGLATVPLVLFALGLGGRWMGALALVVQVAVHHGNGWMQHGGDRLLRLWTLSLLTVPCTAALSLDAWLLPRVRRLTVPATAHRLIQLQLCLMYVATGLAKAPGRTWQRGEAVYYAMSSGNFQRAPGLVEPLLASSAGQLVLQLGTWVTLAWELAFPLLVLWWPTRLAALGLGVLVHGGIAATMMVGTFSFAAVWAYLAFLDPDRLGRVVGWVSRRTPPSSPEGAPR